MMVSEYLTHYLPLLTKVIMKIIITTKTNAAIKPKIQYMHFPPFF